jgi:dihydroneopterin aldolase/2-amino-4-hydroxy-6-hydroxymethyldihydropteridine diphosphokinase
VGEPRDRIVVTGIRGHGRHGVFDHERRDGQEFAVDVELEVGTTAAARSDDLADTVDYGQVAIAVHALIVGEPVDLVETLAERIADACLAFGGVHAVTVTVHKPSAPIPVPFDDVQLRIRRTAPVRRPVALALGSNLGDSATVLQAAVDDLAALPGLRLGAVSAVYRTAPVGGPEQPDYLNAVVVGETTLDPLALLTATQGVERAHHRVRDVRWGPRTLDVDVIALGDEVVDEPTLQVPHPRAHERAFVLVPWTDADPAAVIPGRGPVADLVAGVDRTGVTRTDIVLELPAAAS